MAEEPQFRVIYHLDSETTGLDFQRDEVIELALVTGSGALLFSSLIQPEDPDQYDLATHIHGITREMLKTAPRFAEVWPQIEQILWQYQRVLIYNAFFAKGACFLSRKEDVSLEDLESFEL